MAARQRADGDPSRSAASDDMKRHLRIVVACEVVFMLVLVGVWLMAPQLRASRSLLVFFLYGIPCEFLVSVMPHEPVVLYIARFHDPLIVALVAGGGTLIAEAINYDLMRHVGATAALSSLSRARILRRVTELFARAPFLALWIAGFVPVIPFTSLRLLVVLHRYPRGRYLAASVSSRTARFYVVAVAGKVIRLPVTSIVILFVVLLLVVTIPGAYRILAGVSGSPLDEHDAPPQTEPRAPWRTR